MVYARLHHNNNNINMMMGFKSSMLVCAVLFNAVELHACVLQGTDSGICMDFDEALKLELPFCGEVINYRVCVPQYKVSISCTFNTQASLFLVGGRCQPLAKPHNLR